MTAWVIYLFGSGAAFFAGIGLVALSLLGFSITYRHWIHVISTLVAIAGLLLIALSATPLPYWVYGVAGLGSVLWLVAERSRHVSLRAQRKWFRVLVAALWLPAAAVECAYERSPVANVRGQPPLYIIGDSVAAGMDEHEDTWPRRLARTGWRNVADYSRVGATAASALRQADNLPEAGGGIVLLEIGGNDLLGSTRTAEFSSALERLLARVCRPQRTVLMFELPLPPFCNEYGRIQRRLAANFGVTLIPKRLFAAVLTQAEATIDSIHLTPRGHERMAMLVTSVLRREDD